MVLSRFAFRMKFNFVADTFADKYLKTKYLALRRIPKIIQIFMAFGMYICLKFLVVRPLGPSEDRILVND